MHAVILAVTTIIAGWPSPIALAQAKPDLTLQVFLLEEPQAGKPATLWLKVTNHAPVPKRFCRSSWFYSWLPASPGLEGAGQASVSIHGCGDEANPFWILLPGESHIDGLEVSNASADDAKVIVDVGLSEFTLGFKRSVERDLSWRGTASELLAAGDQLKRLKRTQ